MLAELSSVIWIFCMCNIRYLGTETVGYICGETVVILHVMPGWKILSPVTFGYVTLLAVANAGRYN